MELNRLAVRARLRSPWESIDLGIALARRLWLPLFLVWLLPAAVVFGAAALLIGDSPAIGYLLLWWLKPVYDRLPLHIASRALFSERVTASATLRQFFSVNRRDWLAWISWRRFSVTRSFDMPVTLLEQSSGTARNARLAVLHRKNAGAASWLTLTCVHVEMFLALGIMALVYLLIPEQTEIQWLPFLSSGEIWLQWLLNGISLLVMAAVAPFYVFAGFMLYIGRRIELEAWDLEIHFRNLRERHAGEQRRAQKRGTVAAQWLLVCMLTLFGAASAPPATAQAPAQVESPEQARELIDRTLAGEDFHRVEEVSGWRLKDFEKEDSEIPEWLIEFIEWLFTPDEYEQEENSSWGPALGTLMELLLWGLAAALLVYLLWRYREQIQQTLRPRTKTAARKSAPPETLFGLDVRESSLPADVCAEVLRLWQSGKQRAGLGLLYRATLAYLINRHQFEFGDQLTERECALLVEARGSGGGSGESAVGERLVQFVHRLTADWQQLAYAHRIPERARVEVLCGQWREVFGDAA